METGSGDALRRCEEAGRALLQMKPLDRASYTAWSDGVREVLGGLFGPDSAAFKDFFQARRAISVRFESDPSYHLTQLGANLRRELDVLRGRIALVDGGGSRAARPTPTSPPTVPLVSIPGGVQASASPSARSRTSASVPAPISPTHPIAPISPDPREDLGFILLSFGEKATELRVLEALRPWKTECLGLEEILGSETRIQAGARAVILVGAVPRGRSGESAAARERARARLQDLAFAAGLLLGSLGRERVCLLLEDGADAPPEGWGLASVSLADPDGWRPKVLRSIALDRAPELRAAGA